VSQDRLLKDLRADLAKGNVLVVAGTGVSIQASGNQPCASWSGLISDGIDHCLGTNLITDDEAEKLRKQLAGNSPAKMIKVAETISTTLGAPDGEFLTWLQESVGTLSIKHREIIDTIYALGTSIATTNYDALLARACGIDAVPWTSPVAPEFMRGDRDAVLHLHGYYLQPDSVILGVNSYKKILADRGAQAIQQALIARSTLLFIGSGDGLSDPNFGTLLKWSAAAFGKSRYRHYCLCRKSERAELQKRFPPSTRFFYIEYGDDYADLAPFLRRELVPYARPRKPTSSTLPAAGYCIGRDVEVEEVVATLLADKPQPLPILGGPGMGKTTIALTALHDKRVANRFGSRRWFIRCDGVKTRPEMAAAIAKVLGLAISLNIEQAVLNALEASPAALVIDNAETPLDASKAEVEELLAILSTIESLAIVATIRAHSRPSGMTWRKTIEAERLEMSVAREAFVAIAGKQQFKDDPYLERLLSVLDGMPLAITLMARYAEAYQTLEPVWARWQAKRTAMLKDGEGADRRTNIAVSYELSIAVLTPEARRLLSVLAILPEGIAAIDLASVVIDPDDASHELHRRALVFDEARRLRMLAPLREYVAAEHPPEEADERRCIDYYIGLAGNEGVKLGGADGKFAIARLAPEVGNIEAMFVGTGRGTYKPIAPAIQGWTELMRFTGLGSPDVLKQAALRASDAGNAEDFAWCIESLGSIALARSEYDEAQARYEQVVLLHQQAGSIVGEANCNRGLGDIALRRIDYAEAAARYEEALKLYQKIGAVRGEANCIHSLGNIALARSDKREARARYEQALPLYKNVGDLLGEANCVRSLGDVALWQSDYDGARARYDQAAPLYQKIGTLLGEANCLQRLGDIARLLRRKQEAKDLYRKSLTLYERIQERYSIGVIHLHLAKLASTEGRSAHVTAAREAWRSIKRDDLVAQLDKEFGAENH